MAKKRKYPDELAKPIPYEEAIEKGPVAIAERLLLLAEHYGIDHRNQPFKEWLAPLAIALAAEYVPGFQIEIETKLVKKGGRPAFRKLWEDVVVLFAVEAYQEKHMPGRRNYKRACERIAMRVREKSLTPEIERIPKTYLVHNVRGMRLRRKDTTNRPSDPVASQLLAACDRGRALRKKFPKIIPIGAVTIAELPKQ